MGGGPPPPTSSQQPPPPNTDGGQTYCLRWNNHKSNLVEILDALIKVESYVDCTIVVDDQVQFKAHRVVLAANSPYFGSILQDVPMDHCSIIFPGVKAFEMRALLEYMYTGEVNVTQSQIPKIMRIAEELEVKGLFDMADLKEKFNRLSEEHAERAGNPYAGSSALSLPYASAATSSSAAATTSASSGLNGKDYHSQQTHATETQIAAAQHHHHQHAQQQQQQQHHQQQQHNSSSVISTSSNISPSAAPTSSSSPPYSNYKSPYSSLYTKSPPSAPAAAPQTSTSAQSPAATQQSSSSADRNQPQWPLPPSVAATAAALLGATYESAPDMNPLKRKKLSSMNSMLMQQRDTPILRNVLAQSNPADSSQPMPLLLPGNGATAAGKGEKSATAAADKNSQHAGHAGAGAHNNNHSFNGSDYSSDKKYQDEPHSPYTDRSFDEEGAFDPKSNFAGNFAGAAGAANQKPEWKRYKQYTRTDIMSAIQCVREGMSALQASRKFNVPSRTLYDKVKKLGITTGRPMNRTMKRSPSNVESSAAFPYAHGYGQSEPLLSSMHDGRSGGVGDEREPKDPRDHHLHMPPTIPHPAAALLDHAFLQQALENRGGDLAGRDALHAMALAAAAHAAANQQRLSASPGPNGGGPAPLQPPSGTARSPSPSAYGLKYARPSEHELLMAAAEREKERRLLIENELELERERELEMEREHRRELDDDADDDDEEDDHVEDLSVARKHSTLSPTAAEAARRRSDSPYSPPSPRRMMPPPTPPQSATTLLSMAPSGSSSGVIMPPISSAQKMLAEAHGSHHHRRRSSSSGSSVDSGDDNEFISTASMKRELIIDESRAD